MTHKYERGDWLRWRGYVHNGNMMVPTIIIDEVVYLTKEKVAGHDCPHYLTSHGHLVAEKDVLEVRRGGR